MLDIIVLGNYLNIIDLINISKTDKYQNILIKENLKYLVSDYYNKNLKDKKGDRLSSEYTHNKNCENCKRTKKINVLGYIDPFSKKISCKKCKTRGITKSEAYRTYKLESQELKELDYLYYDSPKYQTFITIYPLMEVLIKFYLKFGILNPRKQRLKAPAVKTEEPTKKDIRWLKVEEIIKKYKKEEYISYLKNLGMTSQYIKDGSHGIRKVKKYIIDYVH
jgi:hypothetical protein